MKEKLRDRVENLVTLSWLKKLKVILYVSMVAVLLLLLGKLDESHQEYTFIHLTFRTLCTNYYRPLFLFHLCKNFNQIPTDFQSLASTLRSHTHVVSGEVCSMISMVMTVGKEAVSRQLNSISQLIWYHKR